MRHDVRDLAGAGRAIVSAYGLPALVAQRNASATALEAKRYERDRALGAKGAIGRVSRLLGRASHIGRLDLQVRALTDALAENETRLAAASGAAFSALPPLAVVAAAVRICRHAREYFQRDVGHEHNSRPRERELTEQLCALGKRVVDSWAPGFEPARFVSLCRARAQHRAAPSTRPLARDGRLGFHPVSELELVELAAGWQESAAGNELRALVDREARQGWTSSGGVGAASASELYDRALLEAVAGYPPMRVWLAAQHLIWLLHGIEWAPSERAINARGQMRWTTLVLLRAWQLDAVEELERTVDATFPGLSALVGGTATPLILPGAVMEGSGMRTYAARARLHASIVSGAALGLQECHARMSALERLVPGGHSPTQHRAAIATGLVERHRDALKLIAAEQARMLRGLTLGEHRLRVRNHLVAVWEAIDEIRTVDEQLGLFARSAPVFGKERAFECIRRLRSTEPTSLQVALLAVDRAIDAIRPVCIARDFGETPGSRWELTGVEQAVSALEDAARAIIAEQGPLTPDAELLLEAWRRPRAEPSASSSG